MRAFYAPGVSLGNGAVPLGIPFKKGSELSEESKAKRRETFKRKWAYAQARKAFYEALSNIKLPNGETVNFWKKAAAVLQEACFGEKSALTKQQKIELIVKLANDFLPDDRNNREDTEAIQINFDKEDSQL